MRFMKGMYAGSGVMYSLQRFGVGFLFVLWPYREFGFRAQGGGGGVEGRSGFWILCRRLPCAFAAFHGLQGASRHAVACHCRLRVLASSFDWAASIVIKRFDH